MGKLVVCGLFVVIFLHHLASCAIFQRGKRANNVVPKVTAFMNASQLALHGNLAKGDILESQIVVKRSNGSAIILPLYHKAVVVDPELLQIVHYRFKDENDTTPEERRKVAELEKDLSEGAGPLGVIRGMFGSMVNQLMRDVRNVDSLDDLRRIELDCKGPLKNGLLNLMYSYDARRRKVYQDNLVASIEEPVRVNNELDSKWPPISGEQIAQRAISRIGEEKFDLQRHNCETFANWARYNVNYTAQGERFGSVLNTAITGFNQLCERAQRDVKNQLESAVRDIRSKRTDGTMKGTLVGGALGMAGCILSAGTLCAVTIPAGLAVGGTTGYVTSYKDAIKEAASDGEYALRNKLEREYLPSATRLLKEIVQKLGLDKVILADV